MRQIKAAGLYLIFRRFVLDFNTNRSATITAQLYPQRQRFCA